MRVRLLVPICGPNGSFKAGDTPDLPESLAEALTKNGHAEAIEVEELESEIHGVMEKVKEVKKTVSKKQNP